MAESYSHKAVTGTVWVMVNRFTSMGLQFLVNIILARILMPDDFGAIGMIAIFISVSSVLVDGGFASALIQKKEPTQTDYSTIFYWNLGLSVVLYAILFVFSPLIAGFFELPELKGVMRGIGLVLIISSLTLIQDNRLRKQLAFKKLAITDISAYVFAGSMSIFLAYHGWGVYALVALQVISGLTRLVILWFLTHWHPSLVFSKESFKSLFNFGGYLLAAGLLQEICKNMINVVIGRRFSSTQLGFYSQAYKLDQIASYTIPQILVQVMYPVYSSLQDERERLIQVVLMNIRVISFMIFPLMAFLILMADPIFSILYGDKWLPSVPYFQILCVGGLFVCLQNTHFYAVASCGHSKTLFRWSLEKWSFLLAGIFIGMNFGMIGLCWCIVLSSFNIFAVNAYLSAKKVGITLRSQTNAILPVAMIVVISFLIAEVLIFLVGISPVIGGLVFIATYILGALIFKLKALTDSITVLKKLRHK